VSIGVGPLVDRHELEIIAMGDKSEVFKLDSFEDLVKRLKDILMSFCAARMM